MCISLCTRFITSTGHGDPAMIPVRSVLKSKLEKFGRASSAMNIVGTPYSDVQRSAATAPSESAGSKDGAGITIVAAWVTIARLPSTIPKQ